MFVQLIAIINFDESRVVLLVLVAQSCPTLCNPMDCSPPGSSVHEAAVNLRNGCLWGTLILSTERKMHSLRLVDFSFTWRPYGRL